MNDFSQYLGGNASVKADWADEDADFMPFCNEDEDEEQYNLDLDGCDCEYEDGQYYDCWACKQRQHLSQIEWSKTQRCFSPAEWRVECIKDTKKEFYCDTLGRKVTYPEAQQYRELYHETGLYDTAQDIMKEAIPVQRGQAKGVPSLRALAAAAMQLN